MAEQNIVATNSEFSLRTSETSEHYNILIDNSSDSTYNNSESSGGATFVVIAAPDVTSPLDCENVAISESPANPGDEAPVNERVVDRSSPSYSTDSSDTSLASIDNLYYSINSQEYSRANDEQYGTPLLTSTPRTPEAINYVLDRATPSTSRPHVRLRRRHLNFNDSDVDSEGDEPAPKRTILAEWIDDMEQLFGLRVSGSVTTDDEE